MSADICLQLAQLFVEDHSEILESTHALAIALALYDFEWTRQFGYLAYLDEKELATQPSLEEQNYDCARAIAEHSSLFPDPLILCGIFCRFVSRDRVRAYLPFRYSMSDGKVKIEYNGPSE
jgi:hypothetical protein